MTLSACQEYNENRLMVIINNEQFKFHDIKDLIADVKNKKQ